MSGIKRNERDVTCAVSIYLTLLLELFRRTIWLQVQEARRMCRGRGVAGEGSGTRLQGGRGGRLMRHEGTVLAPTAALLEDGRAQARERDERTCACEPAFVSPGATVFCHAQG